MNSTDVVEDHGWCDREPEPSKLDLRVVFLSHYIPLYQVRVLQQLAASVGDFRVLLSTPIEPNRDFAPDWSGLDVQVQNTWTFRRRWRHKEAGFDDPLFVHFPYDTLRQLRALKPDVVVSLELGARSAGAAYYCRRHPETKLVLCTYMSERTEQGRGWLRQRLREKLVREADAITYNGPSCRAYLEKLGAAGERLFHFPYAADDRTVYRGPLDRDELESQNRILVAGQLSERKGVLPMLRQLDAYCRERPDRRIEIDLVGDGPLRAVIESFQTPENLVVRVLGSQSPDDLVCSMLKCGVLIAPSLADEWMLVVNEALHAGLPVIGSIHAQSVTTLIESGVNGWRYDPSDEAALGRTLDHYFQQLPETIIQMRQAARESVEYRTPQWAARGVIEAIARVGSRDHEAVTAAAHGRVYG